MMHYDFIVHQIECIIIATEKSIQFSNGSIKPVTIPDWNMNMLIAREKYLFW